MKFSKNPRSINVKYSEATASKCWSQKRIQKQTNNPTNKQTNNFPKILPYKTFCTTKLLQLTFSAPTPQNGQTHLNNSSASWQERSNSLSEFDYFAGLALKDFAASRLVAASNLYINIYIYIYVSVVYIFMKWVLHIYIYICIYINDTEIRFIDKTDPSDPTRREDFWIDTLKSRYPQGLNNIGPYH